MTAAALAGAFLGAIGMAFLYGWLTGYERGFGEGRS